MALIGVAILAASACERDQPTPTPAAVEAGVASRTVFADELLWRFGPEVRARVVALSTLADDRRYSTVAGEWPETIPRLGPNPEELLALGPSLVFLASFSAPEYRAAIEGKVETLILDDFDSFDGYLRNVERVGEALDERKRAAVLRREFSQRRAKIERERGPSAMWPTVISWGHGYVAGAHTTFDDAATCAGFINLARREGVEGHQRLDVEQLVAWDPRYIVIGCGERPCAEAVAELAAAPGLGALAAVSQGRVIAIEAPYLSTTGAGMLELSARMQARLKQAGP